MRTRKMCLLTLAVMVLSLVPAVVFANGTGEQAGGANATAYPVKPITLIVPYAAGGGTDVGARLLAKYAEKYIGQPFIVQNVPGAGGEVGYAQMCRSAPDGYTISTLNLGHVTLTVSRKASFEVLRDSRPIALIVKEPGFIVVRKESPIKSMKDLAVYAKANPNKFTVGTSGAGGSDHFGVMGINKSLGVELKAVHFGGAAEAKAAFLGGHVDSYVPSYSEAKELVDSGKITVLAVTADKRLTDMPDVPTFTELKINAPFSSTRGFAAPAGTPDAVIRKLAETFKKVSEDPGFKDDMAKMGLPIVFLDPASYTKLVEDQYAFFSEMFSKLDK